MMNESETPILAQLHRNALAVEVREQHRALYWKTFAKLQLELLSLGELIEPNAMKLTLKFGNPIERTVTYRRVTSEEFGKLSEKTPRTVEDIPRPDAAINDHPAIRVTTGRDNG